MTSVFKALCCLYMPISNLIQYVKQELAPLFHVVSCFNTSTVKDDWDCGIL
jgi:hypothetical protein